MAYVRKNETNDVDFNRNRNEFILNLGTMLGDARNRADISQQHMADLIGCSRSHIGHIEAGTREIRGYEIYVYCRALELSASDLFNDGDGHAYDVNVPSSLEKLEVSKLNTMLDIFSDVPNNERVITNIESIIEKKNKE